jgi:hypothetical protein
MRFLRTSNQTDMKIKDIGILVESESLGVLIFWITKI